MSQASNNQREQLDAFFEKFIYGQMDPEEREQIQSAADELNQRFTDAADLIRGIMADREGREALAKALNEGRRHG